MLTEIRGGAGWKKCRWVNMWLLPKERRSFLLKSCASLFLVLSLSYTFGQEVGDEVSAETTASVYVNGTVITMDSDDNIDEAIAMWLLGLLGYGVPVVNLLALALTFTKRKGKIESFA